MTEYDANCCREFEEASRLSRRRFLAGVAASSAAVTTTSLFGEAVVQSSAAAVGETGGNVLVVLSLRGGVDGLGLVVPHGDPAYYSSRPTLAVPRSSLIAQDAMFGLHPRLAPLSWMWDSGELAAVHAVGLPVPNRSHFSAIEEVEDADPTSSVRQGWVNRMIGLNATTDPSEAVHLSGAVAPSMMDGPAHTIAAKKLDHVSLIGADTSSYGARRRQQLTRMWAGTSNTALLGAYTSATRSVDRFATVAGKPYVPTTGVTYPGGDLSDALKDTARLIKADLGTNVVSVDYGSWDMHADYGNVTSGRMHSMASALATSVDAFMRDLGSLRSRVTLVTISEFGRRIMENGNRGLDHGWGNMMLVAGAGVKGGRYYGTWPGLGVGRQVDDDLQVTTDYRNVLGEVVTHLFPERSLASVFPGLSYRPLGLTTSAAA